MNKAVRVWSCVAGLTSLSLLALGTALVQPVTGQSNTNFTFGNLPGGRHLFCIGPQPTDPNSLVHVGTTEQGGGTISVNGSAGNNIITLDNTVDGAGHIELTGPGGKRTVGIGTTPNPNRGSVGVFDENGDMRAAMQINPTGQGLVGAAVGSFTQATISGLGFGAAAGVNLTVSGNKQFKIDHPLDPANKYLVHSCVESDQRANLYSGNVTTNAQGEATVILPDYFEALNRDVRYQLTCIGQFAQAIVAKEIENNRFAIKTDKPNVKVSWQVTGERQDAYAKAHPMEVEEYKQGKERGRYLHPELYGRPLKEGIHYQPPVAWQDPGNALARRGG